MTAKKDMIAREEMLEDLMDEKTRLACACSQLNDAIYALEQAQFNLAMNDDTYEHRRKVWDTRDELKEMVEDIIRIQASTRERFKDTFMGKESKE